MSVIALIKGTLIAVMRRQAGFAYIRNADLASPCYIKSGTRFASSSLGKYSYISRNCSFFATDIGKFCSIADHCNCGMPEHRIDCASTSQVFLKGKNCLHTSFGVLAHPKYKRTTIGNDVWIGTNVTIKAGVKIGHGAVIGMGSVVVKDIPDYAIAVGCPARVIRYRFDEETREKLIESAWWDMEEKDIRRLTGAFESPEELLAKLGEVNHEE